MRTYIHIELLENKWMDDEKRPEFNQARDEILKTKSMSKYLGIVSSIHMYTCIKWFL